MPHRTTTSRSPSAVAPLALELHVHGVAGASPEDLLDDPRTVRVTGDATAAVFRRAADADAEAHPERHRDRPVPEAYCWSRLTSGNGTRALWLLLLPFMVANLAHWARPAAPGSPRTARAYGVLVRVVALTLTVLLVAAAGEVSLDLIAWQCAGSAHCAASRSWLGFLAPAEGGWWSPPGRRLALGALLPAALTLLLWYLSHRTWSAYESQPPPPGTPDPDGDDGGAPALGRPGFWYGRRLVARLRAAHTAAGLLTVAAAVAVPVARHDQAAAGPAGAAGSGSPVLAAAGWAVEALLAVGAAAVLWVVVRRGRSEACPDHRPDRAAVSWLPGCALALLAAVLLYAGWSRPGWNSAGRLPGDAFFGLLTVGQGLCVLALALVAARLHRRAPAPGAALGGLGGPAIALLACALGGVMTGGVAGRVADWLDGGAVPGRAGAPLPGPPVLLSWQAAALPPLLALLAVLACAFALRGARLRSRIAATVADEYPGAVYDRARSRRIAGARAAASLTDSAPWLVAAVCGPTLLLGAVAVAGAWLTGEVPAEAARSGPAPVAAAARAAEAAGSWLIGFGFLLFVTWGRRAYRDASARRTVGILWDVGTFWPRAAHPFAPPCYAERAVPDLTWRMTTWTGRTGGRLVLSGHSQGSVLAAAAVWQLPPAVRRRVALLTYGSPLARLYGRWFPAYFGTVPLTALHGGVDCWRNLWRATDPIGGPVLGGTADGADVDRGPLLDPLAYGRTERHPLPAPILGHSDYRADPVFAAERDALLARLARLARLTPAPARAPAPDDAVPDDAAPDGTGVPGPRDGAGPPLGDGAGDGAGPPVGDGPPAGEPRDGARPPVGDGPPGSHEPPDADGPRISGGPPAPAGPPGTAG
ncbi:hypothetical protein [Streptomyces antimicrobicus]|uniref:Integral membrane protein n=1 Tax=Streptomyces antimicrobicus TaxID=2883108 RepID=A0ABS8B6E7_9ACTN|nr:hypothetical protein [Streptomyces antimicrobicus]MCB5180179.1 hypothetical protein [Streptomyces antimicrobicus]